MRVVYAILIAVAGAAVSEMPFVSCDGQYFVGLVTGAVMIAIGLAE